MSDIVFTTLRGKLKGRKLRVHQMANDWLTALDEQGNYIDGIIGLRTCYFENMLDRARIIELHNENKLGHTFKIFFDLAHFLETGTFKQKEYHR